MVCSGFRELLWSSGSLCPGAFAAMSWMRFWAPWLLVCLPLWLLVQGAQPPGWALDPVQLTPRPPGPTESWSSDPSNLPLEFPHPHQQLMYTVVPFLYTGSAGVLPPGPDHWDKPSQHQSLPEVVPVVDSQDQHPESPEELEPLPSQQEASSQPPEPPETDENSANLQAALAEPSYTPEEAEPPVQEEGPAQPPEPSNGAESSPTQQESPARPPDPFEEVVAQPPVHDEVTVPAVGQNQAQHSDLPSVTVEPVGLELTLTPEPLPLGQHRAQHTSLSTTVQPLDLGHPITPEPAEEVGHSTVLQDTAAPPNYPEVTRPHPEQVRVELPTLAEVRVQPLDLEFTVTPGATTEAEPSPNVQETPVQPPQPAEQIAVQHLFHQEGTVPTPSKDKGQHSTPSVTVHPTDLELTKNTELTAEAGHPTALKETPAPSSAHSQGTLPHPKQVPSQRPNLTQVTVAPVDLEVSITQQPEPSESFSFRDSEFSGEHHHTHQHIDMGKTHVTFKTVESIVMMSPKLEK
ncbi:hypothetical protein MC885_003693, partial [Smutsia gigantea]